MERLTLILSIADQDTGNTIAAVVSGNPADITTFDYSLLTDRDYPLVVTRCWTSVIISDEEKARLANSLTLFPSAIFVFHTCDDAMLVIASNSPVIMALQGQPLSPMDALNVLDLAPFSTGVTS